MNRERFEELLPAYLDGDLSAEETAEMEKALAASEELRTSLERSRALEAALVMRRAEVPPLDRFVAFLSPAAAVNEPRRSRAWRVLNAMMSVPALAFVGCVVVGLWTYWHQETILSVFDRPDAGAALGERLARLLTFQDLGSGMNTWIGSLPGGDMMFVTALYSVVTLLILALTGVMTMRFVRN